MLADGRRLLQKGAHMKKLDARSRVTRRKVSSSKRQEDSTAEMRQQLEDLSEKFDLVLPEVTARVAALEHLLREKQLVSRADLISARAFVRRLEE
jgi:Holliday junction resolvasome RuvABC endonuclease subunit